MYPDSTPPQAPIDYLNQIAPPTKKPGLNKPAVIAVVIGIILLLVVAGLALFAAGSAKSPQASMVTLAARLQAMQTVADSSQKNIKSSALRGVNSNLVILLGNANRDITAPLTAIGVNAKKLDKTVVAREKNDPITKTLEEARLNAMFDDTYAREMSFKLTTVSLLMQDIYDRSNSKSTKDFLMTTDKNLEPIKQQFETFNSTTR